MKPSMRGLLAVCLTIGLCANSVSCFFGAPEQRAVFARRAADDARLLPRVHQPTTANSNNQDVVVGKFRAPAPERMVRHKLAKSADFGSRTVGASFRVADESQPEKVVHGVAGASVAQRTSERTVGARIQVSDDGLNYPPSKLSADIYGNVAEIVTAPPEAVENDFLIPTSQNRMFRQLRASN